MRKARKFGKSIVIGVFVIAILPVCARNVFAFQQQPAQTEEHPSSPATEQRQELAAEERAWQEYLHIHPDSAIAYANLGLLASGRGRYTEAINMYRKALSLDSMIPGLKMNLGLALFKSGDFKSAAHVFAPMLQELPPGSADAQRINVLIGMSYFALSDARSIPYLEEATKQDPKSRELRLVLAQSCLKAKQLECVLQAYREILNLGADSAEADMLAGEALDEMNDTAGALEQFRSAARIDSREPNVHFGVGFLLWKLKRYGEASNEFENELAYTPANYQALTYLGDCKIKVADYAAALDVLQRADKINANIEIVHLDLGILFMQDQRRQDALRELQLAEQLNPADRSVHWELGNLYKAMGMKDKAVSEFEITDKLIRQSDETVLNKLQGAGNVVSGPPMSNTSALHN